MNLKNSQGLGNIIRKLLKLLEQPINDFSWSSWENSDQAINEVQQYLILIKNQDFSCLPCLKLLFAPTGPVQEVAISSGWQAEYLELAKGFDSISAHLEK